MAELIGTVLFFVAVRYGERPISTIRCDKLNLPDLSGFRLRMRALFPHLRTITLIGTGLEPSKRDIDYLKEQAIAVQLNDDGFIVAPSPVILHKEDDEAGEPTFRLFDSIENFPHCDISNMMDCSEFLLTFLRCCNARLWECEKFYVADATFSMTGEDVAESEFFWKVHQMDNNCLVRGPQIVSGPAHICGIQRDMFGNGVPFVISSYRRMPVDETAQILVLHGVMQIDGDGFVGFDRTLLIMKDHEKYGIVNDQLHLRKVSV
jgi:hypothetical protein